MKVSEAIEQLKVGDTVWVKGEVNYTNKAELFSICCDLATTSFWICDDDEISLTEPKNEKVEARLAEHWNEDMGDVLWWNFPVEEPPYCGTPLDEHFPKYKTHFSMIDMPNEIEKPKRWVVKYLRHRCYYYFVEWANTDTFDPIGGPDLDYLKVAEFTDIKKAEAVATLVDGSVEEI